MPLPFSPSKLRAGSPEVGLVGRALAPSDAALEEKPLKVLVTTDVPEQKTAWTKARMDVRQILREDAYDVVEMAAGVNPARWVAFLHSLSGQLSRGSHLVIEYPFDQRKRAYMLRALCNLRGIRMIALIHDLDSLRHEDSPPRREMAVLNLFDGLISHNSVMTNWLLGKGYAGDITNLDLFDYCSSSTRAWHETRMFSPVKVVCAGNMSYPKARYIYDKRMAELSGIELSLYGAFFEPDQMPASAVRYKGVLDPNLPHLDGDYHFGLIWDGTRVDTCAGNYGHYMRFNNPHKLSFYVSMGLPVIVWKESAIAKFVLSNGLGIAVSDLREIGSAAAAIQQREYAAMTAKAVNLGRLVTRGHFLRQALAHLTSA